MQRSRPRVRDPVAQMAFGAETRMIWGDRALVLGNGLSGMDAEPREPVLLGSALKNGLRLRGVAEPSEPAL